MNRRLPHPSADFAPAGDPVVAAEAVIQAARKAVGDSEVGEERRGRALVAIDLGRIAFGPAFALQDALQQARIDERCPDLLLFCEHDPVFTVTRRADPAHVRWSAEECRRHGVEVFPVDRGGDVTYHGPGQVVGYVIAEIGRSRGGVGGFMRALEEAVIVALARLGVVAGREAKLTGVWVAQENAPADAAGKVAAMGVRVAHWVSKHGFALNVDPDLTHYDGIVPCGIRDRPVTSIARVVSPNAVPTRGDVIAALVEGFESAFCADVLIVQ